jgi:hypothetical protein
MVNIRAVNSSFRRFASRSTAIALAGVAFPAICANLPAQKAKPAQKIITVIMVDGKSGKTIVPDNFVIRFNHLNAIRNETLTLNDDGSGKVTAPADVTYLSVQGTYHNSIDLYVNCDAGMEKDTSTLHWYSIADILSTGVSAPNECYKGKYAKSAAIPVAPGEFIFYVREIGWRDLHLE